MESFPYISARGRARGRSLAYTSDTFLILTFVPSRDQELTLGKDSPLAIIEDRGRIDKEEIW